MPLLDHLKAHFEMAHGVFNGTVGDLTEEAAGRRLPGATIEPILPVYAHAVCVEDIIVSRIAGRPTLVETGDWAARTGIAVPPAFQQTPEWSAATYHLDGIAAYRDAVFAATGEWLASASEADLDREVDGLTPGSRVPAAMLIRVCLIHISSHGGEIAALKGVMGLKGLPF